MHIGYLRWGAILAALSVALGAFGAHGLKQIALPETVAVFETGVRYQLYHSVALLIAGVLYAQFPNLWMRRAATCFIAGIILFSGSLYVLTLIKATETVGVNGIGAITPLGGLAFIAGWVCIFLGLRKDKVGKPVA